MYTELAGQYIKLGVNGSDEFTPPTHLFVDGIIDKQCPFLFNAGTFQGLYTKVSTRPRRMIGFIEKFHCWKSSEITGLLVGCLTNIFDPENDYWSACIPTRFNIRT
jgi:hypothetical protein